jgi:hypothetical protein
MSLEEQVAQLAERLEQVEARNNRPGWWKRLRGQGGG